MTEQKINVNLTLRRHSANETVYLADAPIIYLSRLCFAGRDTINVIKVT